MSAKSGCTQPLPTARQYQLWPFRMLASGRPLTLAAMAISQSVRQGEAHTSDIVPLSTSHVHAVHVPKLGSAATRAICASIAIATPVSSRQLPCSCGSSIQRQASQCIAMAQPVHAVTIERVVDETLMRVSHRARRRDARSMRSSLKSRAMRISLMPLTITPLPPMPHAPPNRAGATRVTVSKGRTVKTSMKNHERK